MALRAGVASPRNANFDPLVLVELLRVIQATIGDWEQPKPFAGVGDRGRAGHLDTIFGGDRIRSDNDQRALDLDVQPRDKGL